jgi:uncharacterized protein YjbI with pentapeptide repeats
MANHQHLKILREGAEPWNQWREGTPETKPDLIGANLSYASLPGANFRGADLRDADLRRSVLVGADLGGARLRRANLRQVDLNGADLDGADLGGADLNRADLSNANLARTVLNETILTGNDLSAVKGLETIKFDGPSIIATSTLYSSKGNIPESFLRGCGLSDWEIESAKLYNPDLSNRDIEALQDRIHNLRVSRAVQINWLFISYSHKDGTFVEKVETHLIEQGIRCWRDKHHLVAGRLEPQIHRAIRLSDVILIVLSEHATDSDWVEYEVAEARQKEKQTGKSALCPVALDDSWKTCDWPEPLRHQIMKYSILDFSSWEDDTQFQKMFGKLLGGLNLFY